MRLLASLKLGPLLVLLGATACGGAMAHRTGGATPQNKSEAPGDPAHNLLRNSDFSSGSMLPWLTSFSRPAEGEGMVKNGALCVTVKNGGVNRWDAQIRHREMVVQQGHEYVVSFKAWASRNSNMVAKVGHAVAPYTDYWTKQFSLTTEPQQFAYKFTLNHPDDPGVEFAMHFGGHMIQGPGPIDFCFDDIVLSDAQFTPPPPPPTVVIPKVRVNQVGYIPSFPKFATLVNDAKTPLDFQVVDAAGKVVHSGKTAPLGLDPSSGDNLHSLDFSALVTPGKGYVVKVGQDSSDPFDIDKDIYQTAKYDAFKYFYLNRSGIELKMPFTGKPDWARPAGHPKDEAACSAAAKCDYSLDVTGGWYDAGDYGKYVVNAGISVWTLMNWHERTLAMAGDVKAFGDQKDLIPESGNKVPDILDEARWELEFMLRMQVPEGKPLAGMAHHKMHDIEWTALGLAPHESKIKRELRPVSTAATLNLAASAAQGARLFKQHDAAFAARCLKAAEVAWSAAKKNPSILATNDGAPGGGPYDDQELSDEFYWAAAELWITTGKAEYKKEVEQSSLDKVLTPIGGDVQTIMTWQRVDALGKISMALAAPKADRERYRQQIIGVADQFVKLCDAPGYKLPFAPDKAGKYPWGSNSFVINNSLVLGLAHDFTKQAKYRDAAVYGLDYLFGRNAMGQSYVTGYGERPLLYPHHRFWAHQAIARYPSAPPGALSGGPNSGMEDPYVKAAGLPGCKPQKCFVDHSEAWSSNEITINWNAPFMWVLAWTDEQAK